MFFINTIVPKFNAKILFRLLHEKTELILVVQGHGVELCYIELEIDWSLSQHPSMQQDNYSVVCLQVMGGN